MHETSKPRILVVDDEPQAVDVMTYRLGKEFEVFSATNAEEGYFMAYNHHIDVALVDYSMPGDPGTTLLRKLRELAPYCLRVLVTANKDPKIVEQALQEGQIHRFIAKPVNYETLVAELKALLAERSEATHQVDRQRFLSGDFMAGLALSSLRSVQHTMQAFFADEAQSYSREEVLSLRKNLLGLLDHGRHCLGETLQAGAPCIALRRHALMPPVEDLFKLLDHAFSGRVTIGFPNDEQAYALCSEHYLRNAFASLVFAMMGKSKSRTVHLIVRPERGTQMVFELQANEGQSDSLPQRLHSYEGTVSSEAFSEERVAFHYACVIINTHGGTVTIGAADGARKTDIISVLVSVPLDR